MDVPTHRLSFARLLVASALATLAPAAVASATASDPEAVPPSVTSGSTVTVTTTVTDPDDTAGRLDIAAVRHRIRSGNGRRVTLSYRVSTYAGLDVSRLEARHRNLVLEINRDAQPGSERSVRISYRPGPGLIADVFSNATRRVIARADVTLPDPFTVRIRGPRRQLGGRSYFWTSNFHRLGSKRCGRQGGYPVTCQDSVPERGWTRLDVAAWPR